MMNEVSMSPKNPSKPKRTRRKFTPEFKAEAVRIVRTSGKSIPEVARELDLTETCLRTWVLQAQVDEKQDPQGALTTDERAELVRLRRELRTVEQERDFLKKTASYFAKGQS
jgi:transposase